MTGAISKPDPIPMPDPGTFGPAMNALPNDKWRAFVLAMFMYGYKDPVDGARAAGYEDSGKSGIRVQAHRLWHDPRMQAAIEEEAKRRAKGLLPFSFSNMEKIAENPQHKDQFNANRLLMRHGGLVEETKVTHEVVLLSPREKALKLVEVAEGLGVPKQKLLGQLDPEERVVIEAEFAEMDAPSGEKDRWADIEY